MWNIMMYVMIAAALAAIIMAIYGVIQLLRMDLSDWKD